MFTSQIASSQETRAKRPRYQARPARSSGFLFMTRSAHPRSLRSAMQRFAAISLVFVTLLGVGCAKREEKDPRTLPELVRITTASASSRPTQLFTGVVTARVQSDLGFRVSGKITQRLIDVGNSVRAGQPLMRIDITDYAHAITAQAESVAAAKARADQAAADEARYRGLVATGAVSASTYDQIKAASDAARAQLTAA